MTMGMVVVTLLAAEGWCRCGHNQINLTPNQLRSKFGYPFKFLLGKPILDRNIFPLNPAKLAQLLSERIDEDRPSRSSATIQEPDAKDFSCLLRVS